MSRNGSESRLEAPLHPALSLLTAALGVVAMLASGQLLGGQWPLRATITAGSIMLAVPALLTLLLAGRSMPRALALRPADGRTVLLAALLGAALWLASLGLLELQYAVWPPPPGYLEMFRKIFEALRPANAFDAVLSVLAIAAVPAVFEETLVRGVVLPSFRPALGSTGAVLASALLFGLMHADPYRLLFTFAVGSVLGVVRLRAGALLPCILVHATLNTLTFLAAPLVDDPSEPLPDPRPLLGAALLTAGLAATALLLRRLSRDG
jgi:membrane protease YdiL (CAAX protease family)